MNTNVEHLSPGMIISRDVFYKNGLLLIPKGTILTEHIIIQLQKFGIINVYVRDNWKKDVYFREFDKTYSRALDKINDTFKSVKYKQSIDVSKFQDVVEELLSKSESSWSILPYLKIVEQKDAYTLQHSINVSILAMLFGKWLGFSKDDIMLLGISGILHDIGKVLIPQDILNKPGELTDIEYSVMKGHTKLGYQILRNSGEISDSVKNVVLSHHERMNGRGYPFGLYGSFISENARIVAICDVYDAVTSKRVYKAKENPLKGLKIIFDSSYNGLDPYLCKVFLNKVSMAYHGCRAWLNDGRVCKVIKIFPENPVRPWITIQDEFYDLAEHRDLEIVDIL